MATLVNGTYVDFWYYSENKIYAYLYGGILRNDNTVTFEYSSGQVKLIQQTQYGSKGFSMPFGVKNASGTVVTSGSVWWEYDYMYPATFWKSISGLSSWSYTISSNSATSMSLAVYVEDGDKWTSVSFPARPSVSVQSVTDTSVTLNVSIAGYGDASSGSRYIEGAIMDYSRTTYGRPYRYKTATATTSSTFTIDNSSTTPSEAPLTITANTRYKYGGYASTATDRRAQTITGTVVTTCPAPTLTLGTVCQNSQGAHAYITATRGSDGGFYSTRTLQMRYSWEDELGYGEWTDVGDLSNDKLSAMFSLSALHKDSNYHVQARVVTTAGASPVTTLHFTTPAHTRLLLAPKALSTSTKTINAMGNVASFSDGTGEIFSQVNPEVTETDAELYYQDGHVFCKSYLGEWQMTTGTFTPLGTVPTVLSERGITLDFDAIQNYTVDDPAMVAAYWQGHTSEKTQKLYVGQSGRAKIVKKLYCSKDDKAVLIFNK